MRNAKCERVRCEPSSEQYTRRGSRLHIAMKNQSKYFRVNWWMIIVVVAVVVRRARCHCQKKRVYLFIANWMGNVRLVVSSSSKQTIPTDRPTERRTTAPNSNGEREKFAVKICGKVGILSEIGSCNAIHMHCHSSVCFMPLFTCLHSPHYSPSQHSAWHFIGFSFCPRCRRPT